MVRYFLIFALCAYQPFMHSAASSSKPRTSGLALMRSEPEFRPIIMGSDVDPNNFSSKTVLVEERFSAGRNPSSLSQQTYYLKRSFCNIFIVGSKPEYREAMLTTLAQFPTDFALRANELKHNSSSSPSLEQRKQAKDDAEEFPVFYHRPLIFSPIADMIMAESGMRQTLSSKFVQTLTNDDLIEPRFSEVSGINIAVTCVHPRCKESSTLSWVVNDEENPLAKTHSNEESFSTQGVRFVMCTQEGREFATDFLAKINIKELQCRGRHEVVCGEFIKEAKALSLHLCGVAIMPPKTRPEEE